MRNHSSAQSNFLYALLLAIGSSTDNFTVGFTLGIKSNNNNNNPVNEGFAANENQRTFSSDTDDHDRNANASTSTNVVIKRERLGWSFNLCVSLANAIGAGMAGSLGHVAVDHFLIIGSTRTSSSYSSSSSSSEAAAAGAYAALFAGMAFYYLSATEFYASISNYINREISSSDNDTDTDGSKNNNKSVKDALALAVPMTLNNIAGGVAGGASGISPQLSFILAFACSFIMMDLGYIFGGSFQIRWVEEHAGTIAGIIFGFLGNLQVIDYIQQRF